MSPRRTPRDLSPVKLDLPYRFGGGPLSFGDIASGVGGGRLDGGLRLMCGFDVDVDDPGLAYTLTLSVCAQGGRLACSNVSVRQREDGPAVTGAGLRTVTVESYLQLVRHGLTEEVGGLIMEEVARSQDSVAFEPPTDESWAAFDSAQSRTRRPPEHVLPHVARAYREALADPNHSDAPTKEVARRLNYSRGHAARLVAQARIEGLLGPARKGRPGELLRAEEAGG